MKYIQTTAHPKFSASGEFSEVVGTLMDVTERKRAEEALRRLRQLESELAHMNRLSLILNAVEAMGSVEAGPRELLISTEEHQTKGVLVAVRDSGPGIDSENLERVFESFYTTKASGTGMGLSICRSIIDAHGGRLWAERNVSHGAVLRFSLPGEFTTQLRHLYSC